MNAGVRGATVLFPAALGTAHPPTPAHNTYNPECILPCPPTPLQVTLGTRLLRCESIRGIEPGDDHKVPFRFVLAAIEDHRILLEGWQDVRGRPLCAHLFAGGVCMPWPGPARLADAACVQCLAAAAAAVCALQFQRVLPVNTTIMDSHHVPAVLPSRVVPPAVPRCAVLCGAGQFGAVDPAPVRPDRPPQVQGDKQRSFHMGWAVLFARPAGRPALRTTGAASPDVTAACSLPQPASS